MANKHDSKDRLNTVEFLELIPHLDFKDLLLIEYYTDSWYSMIFSEERKQYGCRLCSINQCSIKSLYVHIVGKKHNTNMENVKELYHPEYTYDKNKLQNHKNKPHSIKSKDHMENSKIVKNIKKQSKQNSFPKRTIGKNQNSKKEKIVVNKLSGTTEPFLNDLMTKNIDANTEDPNLDDSTFRENNVEVECSGSDINADNTVIQLPVTLKKSIPTEANLNEKRINPANRFVKKQMELTNNSSKQPNLPCPNPVKKPIPDCGKIKECKARSTDHKTERIRDNVVTIPSNSISHIQINEMTEQTYSSEPDKRASLPDMKNSILEVEARTNPLSKVNIKCVALSKLLAVEEHTNKTLSSEMCTAKEIVAECDMKKECDENDKCENTIEVLSEEEQEEPLAKQKLSININGKPLDSLGQSTLNVVHVDSKSTVKSIYQVDKVIIPTVDKVACALTDPPKFSTKTFCSNPDEKTQGLIGVEYVIKILKYGHDPTPMYECSLCELNLNGVAMQNHLIGYNHRLKFCEKHFPTAVRQFQQYMSKLPEHEIFKVMTPVLDKLAIAIEEYHGRELPYRCLEGRYKQNRHEILSNVYSFRHASEQYGPSFVHVVSAKEVDQLIEIRNHYKPHVARKEISFDTRFRDNLADGSENRKKNTPEKIQHTQRYESNPYRLYSLQAHYVANKPIIAPIETVVPVDNETHKLMVEHFLRDNLKGSKDNKVYKQRDKRKRSRSTSSERKTYQSHSHFRKSMNLVLENSSHHSEDVSRNPSHYIVFDKLDDLNKQYRIYRKDPENHPLYNQEWEKFWKRRKDELIAQGIDHRTYNYQIEWVQYFKDRIEELYTEAVINLKLQSSEEFHPTGTKDHSVNIESVAHESNTISENENIKVPGVIAVLRFMTALEEHLGSLGPKIIELLSKALQTEKTNPEEMMSVILSIENCTLLQTAKEKFKGLIIAGLLDKAKERALKKAIGEVEDLLIYADSTGKNNEQNTFFPSNKFGPRKKITSPPVVISSKSYSSKNLNTAEKLDKSAMIGELLAQSNKRELAAKLATTLIAQGRADIDPEQLQQLIAVYTVLEKKKREAANSLEIEKTINPTSLAGGHKALSETLTDLLNPTGSKNLPSHYAESSNSNDDYLRRRTQHVHENGNNNMAVGLEIHPTLRKQMNNQPFYGLDNALFRNRTPNGNFNNIHNNRNLLDRNNVNFGFDNQQVTILNSNIPGNQSQFQRMDSIGNNFVPHNRFLEQPRRDRYNSNIYNHRNVNDTSRPIRGNNTNLRYP